MTEATPQAPGVSVAGRDSTRPPVTPTAIAGFVGIAERGPIAVPQPLHGWGDYLEVFGDPVPYGHLAETVHAFFLNGGEKCWVVRAADLADHSAENLPGASPRRDLLARASSISSVLDRLGQPALTIQAANEGAWGNAITFAIDQQSSRELPLTTLRQPVGSADVNLEVESILDLQPGESLGLSAPDGRFVRTNPIESLNATLRRVTLSAPVGDTFPARSTVSGRGFRMQFRCGARWESYDQLSMTPGNPRYFLEVIQGRPDLQSYIDRREHGFSLLVRLTHRQDSSTHAWASKPVSTPPFDAATGVRRLTGGGDGARYASINFPATGGTGTMTLIARDTAGTATHDLHVRLEDFATSTALPVLGAAGLVRDEVVVEDASGFVIGDALTLTHTPSSGPATSQARVIDGVDAARNTLHVSTPFGLDFPIGTRATVPNRFDVVVARNGEVEPLERLHNLSGDPAAATRWYKTRINLAPSAGGSRFLRANGPDTALTGLAGSARLQGGVDPGAIAVGFYTGYETDGRHFAIPGLDHGPLGLAALEETPEPGLVALPDLHRVGVDDFARAQRDVLLHCAVAGGRFALLDPLPDATVAGIATWPLQFADPKLAKHGALYFPWVLGALGDSRRLVPPCGCVAGQMAASDRAQGVGKAPANRPLKGVVALAVDVDEQLQAQLNPAGINCLRRFDDGQIRVFGSRTLSREAGQTQVNVRRVLLTVTRTLSQGMLWAVFEPNDAQLRRRITATLTRHLTAFVAGGVTASPRAEDSFYVRCDDTNNPPETQDAGQVIAEVGIAVAAPAEFIVLTARRSPESLSLIEEDV